MNKAIKGQKQQIYCQGLSQKEDLRHVNLGIFMKIINKKNQKIKLQLV